MTSTHRTNHDEQRPLSMKGLLALAGLLVFLACSSSVGASTTGTAASFPARIDLPDGFFPEGIEGVPGRRSSAR